MPITPTYPGVYVEEISSGVRSITGVSTSVTAFIGLARRGPINKPVTIQSYAEFERRFGGLQKDFALGYAVAAFFRNGGSQAIVVRVALNSAAASKNLVRASDGKDVLAVTALEEGAAGNDIKLQVDPSAKSPASYFDLTVAYSPAGETPVVEKFTNLSMNSFDLRYAPDIVNRGSELVAASRILAGGVTLPAAGTKGTSESAALVDGGGVDIVLSTLLDATHNAFLVSCNSEEAVLVTLAAPDMADLTTLAGVIQSKVQTAKPTVPAYKLFTCAVGTKSLVLTSGEGGENSTVRVLPAPRNDISVKLKLGVGGGGKETDASSILLPKPAPVSGTLKSDTLVSATIKTLPKVGEDKMTLSLDGRAPDTFSLGTSPIGGTALADQIPLLADLIATKVRSLHPTDAAYKYFTAYPDGNSIVLASGTRGTGSSVVVTSVGGDTVVNDFKLIAGAVSSAGADIMLQGGAGDPFDESQSYNVIFGGTNAADRKGIYALDSVDIFNLLILPGLTDPNVQNEAVAYAAARRAFVILDPPRLQDKPEEIAAYVNGPSLTKASNAAIFYPAILNADPLDGNRLKPTPPSGSVAGLFARTDSNRGIWKAPAGIEANLVNTQGTEYVLTDGQNGNLNPLGVNVIRVFPGVGTVVWGSRTLRGDDDLADEYKYIPVRRLAYYIEESLFRGLQWAVFEPNDEPLWAQIRLNAGSFMQTLFRQGAFAGRSPREAYFVKCDKETTTAADIGRGVVNVLIGFAPLRPAEFVMVSIQQIAGQGG